MGGVKIDIIRRPDLEALGDAWRALETRLSYVPFFRSWTWVGCLAAERFQDAVLLRAERDGQVVALALFNRRGGRLCLGEAGDAILDAPFVEHNGPLMADDPALCAALLRQAAGVPGVQRLVLGGVAPALVAAAPGVALRSQERLAPYVDLTALRAEGRGHLDSLSANARQQIRRSIRHFGRLGALRVRHAETAAEAEAMLARMIVLHERSWQARGKPGAFAQPFARRFHAELLRRALPRGELDLLEFQAGAQPVGVLYNFRRNGTVYAYQSGFDHSQDGSHGKPGLTCHALAIERSLAAGDAVYDFLGGADRYKRSLARRMAPLQWAEMVPRWSAMGMALRAWHWGRDHAGVLRGIRRGRSDAAVGGTD